MTRRSDLAYLLRHVPVDQVRVLSVELADAAADRRAAAADSPPHGAAPSDQARADQRGGGGEGGGEGRRRRRRRLRRQGLSRGPPYAGYSGLAGIGAAAYVPVRNDGTTLVTVEFYGHKQRSVDWAQV